RTVLDHFDVRQDDLRDHVEVEARAGLAARAGRARALAVAQDERAVRTQAAQVDGLNAGAAFDGVATELAIDLRGARRSGGRLQEVGGVELAAGDVVLYVDHLHGRGGLVLRTLQQGTRDGDRLEFLGLLVLLLLLGRVGLLAGRLARTVRCRRLVLCKHRGDLQRCNDRDRQRQTLKPSLNKL